MNNCSYCCEDENFAYFVIGDTEKDSRIVMMEWWRKKPYHFVGEIQSR